MSVHYNWYLLVTFDEIFGYNRMLNKIGFPRFERQEMNWGGEVGFGNETVVDRVPPDMMHMIDPTW